MNNKKQETRIKRNVYNKNGWRITYEELWIEGELMKQTVWRNMDEEKYMQKNGWIRMDGEKIMKKYGWRKMHEEPRMKNNGIQKMAEVQNYE